ncbi:MAG: ubiquitin-like domain-containing protein [Promethearchaeota archaeon]
MKISDKAELIKVIFKDPTRAPGENEVEKWINKNDSINDVIKIGLLAFNIDPKANKNLLYKSKRLNPEKTIKSYYISNNAILYLVPGEIKGGFI